MQVENRTTTSDTRSELRAANLLSNGAGLESATDAWLVRALSNGSASGVPLRMLLGFRQRWELELWDGRLGPDGWS
jgi:hypothetical protein